MNDHSQPHGYDATTPPDYDDDIVNEILRDDARERAIHGGVRRSDIRMYEGALGTIDRMADGWFLAKTRRGEVVGRRDSLNGAMFALRLRVDALAELHRLADECDRAERRELRNAALAEVWAGAFARTAV